MQQFLKQSHPKSFTEDANNPQEQLADLIEIFFGQSLSERRQKLLATVFELRTRAIHSEDYREHFSQSDSMFEEYIASLIQEGMNDGVFQSCNPSTVAAMTTLLANGALVRRTTRDNDDWIDDVRKEFQRYREQCVYEN
ncbi:TetR family transcriptional regulator C-terminal domain-containing protein [Natrialba sp. SSL1]|uniref:TetR family transcriptional regulator C-terminal domain-containing protein n=1 Tax=Natrialba sp. SSL1 TaxID=1869245 RepID=UPI00373FC970